MLGCESWEMVFASRSKRWRTSGEEERCGGRTLIATSRLEARVLRAVDLPHPSGADGGEHLVGAEAGPGGERHWVGGILVRGGERERNSPLTLPAARFARGAAFGRGRR